MEFLRDLGIIGFLFFFIKGLLWLVLFALMYFGFIDKSRMMRIKKKLSFWKKKEN